MKIKRTPYAGNNRKPTRGRCISYTRFEVTKEIQKDMGFTLHTAEKHLISVCPQTGKKLYAKQGKAKKDKFVTTLTEGTIINSSYTIKHWKEGDIANAAYKGLY